MSNRTSTARVAFLLVVAALVLQTAPAWADPASGASKARPGHQVAGTAARHAIGRHAGGTARFGSAAVASAFAPGGHAAALQVRALERPFELVALTLVDGTAFTPATAPAFFQRLRE